LRLYALRWGGLFKFVDNGSTEIDGNVVERSIRPIAITTRWVGSICTLTDGCIGLQNVPGMPRPPDTWSMHSRRIGE
jgi:hypothetical protein